jgi:uncharacterized protein YbcI
MFDVASEAEGKNGPAAAEISNRVVQLMREFVGRGPTRARTTIVGDLVVVVLQDTLLKAEKSLVADGRSEMVLDMRRTYQETLRSEFVGVVQEVLGRSVLAFMSDHHLDPDMAVEVFVLGDGEVGAEGD